MVVKYPILKGSIINVDSIFNEKLIFFLCFPDNLWLKEHSNNFEIVFSQSVNRMALVILDKFYWCNAAGN